MSFLCVLAAVASFVIETKSSISASGDLPEGSQATYECTYKKGQLTKGNTATLSLTGWQNTCIQRVTLSMRSNKSSGAGSLVVQVGGNTVWKIDDCKFDSMAWHGSYSDIYVPISHTFTPAISSQGDIQILITASANSLYIESYEIEWTKGEARPYNVTLVSDGTNVFTQVSEQSVGSGVVLPSLPDIAEWFFLGWSEIPIAETTTFPFIFSAGTYYYPSFDTRLYAVYTDYRNPELSTKQYTEANSGFYALAFPITEKALNGEVDETMHGVPLSDVSLRKDSSGYYERLFEISPSMIYAIDFQDDTIAQIWHAESGEGIGYKNNNVCAGTFEWHYRRLPDATFAFYVPQDKVYSRVLTVTYDAQSDCIVAACVSFPDSLLRSQALLFEADYSKCPIRYTSYPYGQTIPSVLSAQKETETRMVQMGLYRLYINSNGKKILQFDNL